MRLSLGIGLAMLGLKAGAYWVDFHLFFNDTMNIREAHRIATSIEKKISGNFAFRVVVSTHLEPWQDHEKIHRHSS